MSSVNPVDLAHGIFDLARNIGGLNYRIEAFEENPPEEAEIEEAEALLLQQTSALVHQRKALFESAKEIDGIAGEILKAQLEEANRNIEYIINSKTGKIFDKQFNPQIHELTAAVQDLAKDVEECISSKNLDQKPELQRERNQLLGRVEELEDSQQRTGIEFSMGQREDVANMYAELRGNIQDLLNGPRDLHLSDGIDLEAPSQSGPQALENLLYQIQMLIDAGPSALDETIKKRLNVQIDALGASMPNLIDGQIYALAPKPKGGPNWGKLHRFDDLNRLKQAIANVISQDFDRWLKAESPLKDNAEAQNLFYRNIHAFSDEAPTDAEPVTWAKQNIAYNLKNIDRALRVVQQELNPPAFFEDEEDDLLASFHEDGKLSSVSEVPETVSPEVAALQQIRDILQITSMSEGGKKTLVKAGIMKLPAEVRNPLFGEIWDLAASYRKNEPKWGENHCVDNLTTLEIALDMQIEKLKKKVA